MAIEILDSVVANQIAAGEVVNRPSSVVKELLENSIDAGAARVQLVIKDAGRTLIQVSDNGCGMDREDAQKCFLPHATSKIRTSEDLMKLRTMGFRGEALASIAAISQVELKTRREQDETGTKVIIEGGEIKQVSDVACAAGTCISVKNIFYNTPARRNFLKSDQIENSHVNDEFLRVALIKPEVAFGYVNNEKTMHNLTTSNAKKRITDLFGSSLSGKLIPLNESLDLVKIGGFVCSADFAKKNKSWQYFFVNGRFMKNNYFANAVERAFGNLLGEKTYPAFFITLDLPPENIDVNIHPTKTEVKFLDDKMIYSVLHAATKRGLGQYALSNEISFTKPAIEFPQVSASTPLPKAPQIRFDPSFNPFDTSEHQPLNMLQEKPVVQPSLFEKDIPELVTVPTNRPVERENRELNLMQVSERYIVVRSKDSVLLIDQSRASQRVIYESVLGGEAPKTLCQNLATPIKHFFAPHISFQLVELLPALESYGMKMEYDKTDGGFFLVAKSPSSSAEECFEMAQNLVEDKQNCFVSGSQNERRAMMIAQKNKIPYGQVLSNQQMQTLISQLFSCKECNLTPEGKKIIIKLTTDDLEKMFG